MQGHIVQVNKDGLGFYFMWLAVCPATKYEQPCSIKLFLWM